MDNNQAPKLVELDRQGLPIEFRAGAHSPNVYAEKFLRPLFENGTIVPHPEADYYAVCYGELCAYADRPSRDPHLAKAGQRDLLAIWSHGVPDCEEDERLFAGASYAGEWVPH